MIFRTRIWSLDDYNTLLLTFIIGYIRCFKLGLQYIVIAYKIEKHNCVCYLSANWIIFYIKL